MTLIFDFKDEEALGKVSVVDTATVIVNVSNLECLKKMQVNRLVALQSSKAGQHLVGIIQKISRTAVSSDDDEEDIISANQVRVSLIGTLIDKQGSKENVFKRTLETVPEIDANCFTLEGARLTKFMQVVAHVQAGESHLSLGTYTLDEGAEAFLSGNKFFQRHALIVGSTGSGKSWTTAHILEQAAALKNVNAIVIDTHGEYKPLNHGGFRHFRIAGPNDLDASGKADPSVIYLPYWLLSYEAIISLFVDRSDQNAPNQAMVISREIVESKRASLNSLKKDEVLKNFTIDSPVPYSITDVLSRLDALNTEMVPGSGGKDKQGDFHGKLSRLIARLENKINDRRLGFLFKGPQSVNEYDWLQSFAHQLFSGGAALHEGKGGIKIIDFSEVPSDILPLIVSLVASLAFSLQQWTPSDSRHPLAIFCDEAHLYIPDKSSSDAPAEISVKIFERISKEGRKYGVGLVVISQRPSEVNRTVLSQCNNVISMRLTNAEDQSVIKRLLPDSLGGFSDILPILDTGEALVVGDASLLPSRIRVAIPKIQPNSGTVNFWDIWASDKPVNAVKEAVENWRKQSVTKV